MFSVAELQEYWLQFHILLQYFESLDSPPGRDPECKHQECTTQAISFCSPALSPLLLSLQKLMVGEGSVQYGGTTDPSTVPAFGVIDEYPDAPKDWKIRFVKDNKEHIIC